MRNKCVPQLLQALHPILGHKGSGSVYLQVPVLLEACSLLSESELGGYFSPEAQPGMQEWGSGPKVEQRRGC